MALRWSDIELDKMLIRVSRSYNTQRRIEKSTKAGYWRTVPISSELHEILNELKIMGNAGIPCKWTEKKTQLKEAHVVKTVESGECPEQHVKYFFRQDLGLYEIRWY